MSAAAPSSSASVKLPNASRTGRSLLTASRASAGRRSRRDARGNIAEGVEADLWRRGAAVEPGRDVVGEPAPRLRLRAEARLMGPAAILGPADAVALLRPVDAASGVAWHQEGLEPIRSASARSNAVPNAS